MTNAVFFLSIFVAASCSVDGALDRRDERAVTLCDEEQAYHAEVLVDNQVKNTTYSVSWHEND